MSDCIECIKQNSGFSLEDGAISRAADKALRDSVEVINDERYTLAQAVEMFMEHPELKIWSSKLFWSASPDEIVKLINPPQ